MLSACGYLRVDRHVCRFFDFSYHLLTALSQLISPRLQDLESLLTTLATVPCCHYLSWEILTSPNSSPYLSVFPTEHLFWSSYFPMHFCHQSSLLQCNLQFSNVVHSITRIHNIASLEFLCISQNTHRTIFYPNFQFFDWQPLPQFANIKEYFFNAFQAPCETKSQIGEIFANIDENGTKTSLLEVILEKTPPHQGWTLFSRSRCSNIKFFHHSHFNWCWNFGKIWIVRCLSLVCWQMSNSRLFHTVLHWRGQCLTTTTRTCCTMFWASIGPMYADYVSIGPMLKTVPAIVDSALHWSQCPENPTTTCDPLPLQPIPVDGGLIHFLLSRFRIFLKLSGFPPQYVWEMFKIPQICLTRI